MQTFIGLVIPFGIMMALMYFMIIKPQKKQAQKHQDLLSSLKTGDKVETYAGIVGTVSHISEQECIVTSEGTKLRMKKNSISQKLG